MKILVIGSGAREHAIAWKFRQSPELSTLYVAPGNAGTGEIATNVPISVSDLDGLLSFSRKNRIDLTVVGPEAPLASGIADRFRDAGLLLFGPVQRAALIESSKSFAKDLMLRHGIPTGAAESFGSFRAAVEYVRGCSLPVVVKADGLAAGKGVVVAQTYDQAVDAVRGCMEERLFGSAGDRILVEEYLEGQEVSVFAFVDGECVSSLVAACDYKRVGEGDVGPNTGGMGSFSPPPFWDTELEHRVGLEIMAPVARAMADAGSPYQGVLYAGLILNEDGPKVLEFNCRLGDPEAQVVLPRLKTDLVEVMMATARGELQGLPIEWDPSACVGVVVASGGYPALYSTGHLITGLCSVDDAVTVFHAGTRVVRGEEDTSIRVVTDGGRVLTFASLGKTLGEARRNVYVNVDRIEFEGSFYRGDIAATF